MSTYATVFSAYQQAWEIFIIGFGFYIFQEPDDLFECIGQALMNAVDRDAVSGWGAIVHIMWVVGLAKDLFYRLLIQIWLNSHLAAN